MITAIDIAWAAGFLEGEGAFGKQGLMVSANQVQREPLERLQRIFGGKISVRPRQNERWQPVHNWWINGRSAASCIMSIYGLMSPRRQGQMLPNLEKWKALPNRRMVDEQRCVRGHDMSLPGNTMIIPHKDGHYRTRCRMCHNAYTLAYIQDPNYKESRRLYNRERRRRQREEGQPCLLLLC